ncbi:sensor histidine kinase [Kineosporia succinea]|uniref:histidine kinase n=1 Tax=Kineosporia succinea TaxID=84632 RepID=A0ABT9NWR2_9ACTN|nr:histidine kinase [Kineosporia succinea]MDP9824594.1 signal transduction histidine kinase [Kineosporia succinea]
MNVRARLLDLPLAAGTIGIEIGLLSDSLGAPGTPAPVLTVALSVVAGLLLLVHRRWPLAVLAAVVGIEAGLAAAGSYPGGAPALVALGLVALHEERRRSLPALAVTAVVLQAGSISAVPVPVIAWGVGYFAQTQLRYIATLEDRNAQVARNAAQAERAAVARELHDIVAHSVTVMLLGVRGARDTLRTDPDLAEEALRRVEKSGEESIAELRRMLAVLRDEPHADRAPAPTIARIPELVAAHRAAGMPVHLRVPDDERAAAGIELTAYRVVQEGLTNVARHAVNPTRVDVSVTFTDSHLEVSVEDDGQAVVPGISTPGRGLVGLRERTRTAGGTLSTGPAATGGFRLTAHLPRTSP